MSDSPIFDALLAEFRKTHPGFKLEPAKAALPRRQKLRGVRPAGAVMDEATVQLQALDNAVYTSMEAQEAEDTYYAAKRAWVQEDDTDIRRSAARFKAFQKGWQAGIVPRFDEFSKEAS